MPFGIVDFIEILQQGRLPTDLWYGFLNLGYKLLPAAGSDFPYMDLPGVVRSYAKIDGPFSVDAWFDAFRAGRLFVTNGPLLEVTANGRPLGDELHVEPGGTVEVVAEASLNPDLDRLDRLELVVHGEVVATEPANDRDRVRLRTTVTADRSLWLAVRAFGERQERGNLTVAHSAPIYVIVEGRPFYRDEHVPELVALQRTRLRELLTEAVDPNRDLEPWGDAQPAVGDVARPAPPARAPRGGGGCPLPGRCWRRSRTRSGSWAPAGAGTHRRKRC